MRWVITMCLLLTASALGDDFSLGRGSNEAQATYIYALNDGQDNNGSATTMYLYCNNDVTGRKQVLAGWLQLADSTMTYDSAFVYLHYESGSDAGFEFKITGLLRDLVEDKVSWDSCEVDPDGIDWTTNGVEGSGTDRMNTWSADIGIADTTDDGDYRVDITSIANDASFNGCFLVRAVSGSANYQQLVFDTDDASTAAERPMFKGYYTTGTPAATGQVIMIGMAGEGGAGAERWKIDEVIR